MTLTSCARTIHEQEELSARWWTPQPLNEAPCTPSSGIGSPSGLGVQIPVVWPSLKRKILERGLLKPLYHALRCSSSSPAELSTMGSGGGCNCTGKAIVLVSPCHLLILSRCDLPTASFWAVPSVTLPVKPWSQARPRAVLPPPPLRRAQEPAFIYSPVTWNKLIQK